MTNPANVTNFKGRPVNTEGQLHDRPKTKGPVNLKGGRGTRKSPRVTIGDDAGGP